MAAGIAFLAAFAAQGLRSIAGRRVVGTLIPNARIELAQGPSRTAAGGRAVLCPRLLANEPSTRPGDRVVVWLDWYDPGELSDIDDELFERLALEVPPVYDRAIDLGSADVRAFYAQGAVAWSEPCVHERPATARGTLTLRRGWLGERAELDAEFTSEPVGDVFGIARSVSGRARGRFRLERRATVPAPPTGASAR